MRNRNWVQQSSYFIFLYTVLLVVRILIMSKSGDCVMISCASSLEVLSVHDYERVSYKFQESRSFQIMSYQNMSDQTQGTSTLQCVTPRLYLALRGHRLEEEFWRRVQTDSELAVIVGSPHTWTYPQMVSTLSISMAITRV